MQLLTFSKKSRKCTVFDFMDMQNVNTLPALADSVIRNPLFHSLDNVLLSPHIGSASKETRDSMADLVISNVEAVFSGKQPLSPVL